jgi:hypothetical protein
VGSLDDQIGSLRDRAVDVAVGQRVLGRGVTRVEFRLGVAVTRRRQCERDALGPPRRDGRRAGAICSVADNIATGEAFEPGAGHTAAIDIALRSVALLESQRQQRLRAD